MLVSEFRKNYSMLFPLQEKEQGEKFWWKGGEKRKLKFKEKEEEKAKVSQGVKERESQLKEEAAPG